MARIRIPYHTPRPCGFDRARIYGIAREAIARSKVDPGEFFFVDQAIRALGGAVEGYEWMSEISLDARGTEEFTVYSGCLAGRSSSRLIAATALGHHLLHFPAIAEAHPGDGMQVVTKSDHPLAPCEAARREATIFARAFLMPEDLFRSAFDAGGVDLCIQRLQMKRNWVKSRARELGLAVPA